jgi:hypothetical protein
VKDKATPVERATNKLNRALLVPYVLLHRDLFVDVQDAPPWLDKVNTNCSHHTYL